MFISEEVRDALGKSGVDCGENGRFLYRYGGKGFDDLAAARNKLRHVFAEHKLIWREINSEWDAIEGQVSKTCPHDEGYPGSPPEVCALCERESVVASAKKPSPLQQAVAELQSLADQLRRWAVESRVGGWSTHQVEPMLNKAHEIECFIERNKSCLESAKTTT